jgi:phospholipase C
MIPFTGGRWLRRPLPLALVGAGAVALAAAALPPQGSARLTAGSDSALTARPSLGNTITPIKHVVVIIGENHTFDNVFGTYRPPEGQTVHNLLSEGIVSAFGGPGPAVRKALQRTAPDRKVYRVDATSTGAYKTLPRPNTTYVAKACDGQNGDVPDTRFPANLPNAPYQITKYVPYFDDHGEYSKYGTCEFNGAYVGDPIHRFYQMYQQVSGGENDLWTWVHETAGDSNGAPPPKPFTN